MNGPSATTAELNDEEFEILESGIFTDETLEPSWSRRHPIVTDSFSY